MSVEDDSFTAIEGMPIWRALARRAGCKQSKCPCQGTCAAPGRQEVQGDPELRKNIINKILSKVKYFIMLVVLKSIGS